MGNGLGKFVGSWSNPSSIDASSIKLDHVLSPNERLFFRFSDTASDSSVRQGGNFATPSVRFTNAFATRTYTFGATSVVRPWFSNDVRLNYSFGRAAGVGALTDFGGAQPADLFLLQGLDPKQSGGAVEVVLFLPRSSGFIPAITQENFLGERRQWNVVESVSMSSGRHQIKAGVDYRRLSAAGNSFSPFIEYEYFGQSSLQSNTSDLTFAQSFAHVRAYFQNFSAFAQDELRVTPRLALSYGLRWEVNPAPGASNGNLPYTVQGGSVATLTLAAPGTPLWRTSWHNVAPRLGIAYVLNDTSGHETVLRSGGGVFFDTGQQYGAIGYNGPGFSGTNVFFGSPGFPAPISTMVPKIVNPPVPPYGTTYGFPSHFQLPYTWQANASLGQALGNSQALTVSYVGAFGRKLLELNQIYAAQSNARFSGSVFFFQNGLTSDYNALQVQFQRRSSHGLQILGSYTLSHSIDYGSNNNSLPYVRGNSDFDVRHNLSAALSYDLPEIAKRGIGGAIGKHWAVDARVMARTGFPVSLLGSSFTDPATGHVKYMGLNKAAGQSIYLDGPQYPGGRAINVNAFRQAPSGQLGDAPRNFVRGFAAWQMDLAVRREFPITERLNLQFRAETFNIFNHPNFGTVNAFFSPGSTSFGIATATLAQSLGVLSPLYQMGGARSMQFALKLRF
jgi:hypothetical protein